MNREGYHFRNKKLTLSNVTGYLKHQFDEVEYENSNSMFKRRLLQFQCLFCQTYGIYVHKTPHLNCCL